MKKAVGILGLVILSFVAIICTSCSMDILKDGVLTIQNDSGITLNEVTLIYDFYENQNVILIGDIADKKVHEHKINDSIGEASITLSFKDEKGFTHSEIVVGYVHKGVSSSRVVISKVNNQFIFTEK